MATRKRCNSQFKAKIVLGAITGDRTVARLASQYGVHAPQINRWTKQAPEHMEETFAHGATLGACHH